MKRTILLIAFIVALAIPSFAQTHVRIDVAGQRSWGAYHVSYSNVSSSAHYYHGSRPAHISTRVSYTPVRVIHTPVYVVPAPRPTYVHTSGSSESHVIYVANGVGCPPRRVVSVFNEVNRFTDPPQVIYVVRE